MTQPLNSGPVMCDPDASFFLPGEAMINRLPSPWRTPFAQRTYLAGAFWAAGVIASWLTESPDVAGMLRVRLDAVGLLYLAGSIAGGLNFFGAGIRAARTLRLDMNFLMSVAIVAAVLIGESFEAATIAFLFSGAELLERYAVDRGRRAVTRLLELAPEQAVRILPNGKTEHVPASQVRTGDVVRVRPGDRIPADGRVNEGISAVNEATITGESLPSTKRPGDTVYAGTLNTDGALDIEVSADAEHSTLARIVQLVRAAEGRRAPIEQFVQRFARVYTPLVALLSVVVMAIPPLFFGGDALEWFVRGLTLLVIACPCALIIATPVTVVSALTSAAKHGVLIKGGNYLESLGSMRALAIDKTGTLTKGQLEVIEFRNTGPMSREQFLNRLVSLESRSEHAVARALVEFGGERVVAAEHTVQSFSAIPGRGVVGCVDDIEFTAGTEEMVGAEVAARLGASDPGTLRVYAKASDGSEAVFVLRDEVRQNAASTIGELHAAGIRPIIMITGDAAATAELVAKDVGVDEYRARLLPEEKVHVVRELRERFGAVGMMGDGVNDAPALAEASVGIAMGAAGSPATIETADVALMADDLSKLPYAVHLARSARRTIRFNIALAIGVKLVLAIGAVTGLVSLAVAVLVGDLGGSLAVTLNALRIAGRRPARSTG
jgi:Cd2+/Zn2+-exporting ATPase